MDFKGISGEKPLPEIRTGIPQNKKARGFLHRASNRVGLFIF
jgi:hypothetical protein